VNKESERLNMMFPSMVEIKQHFNTQTIADIAGLKIP
jgi:hypothetical protein